MPVLAFGKIYPKIKKSKIVKFLQVCCVIIYFYNYLIEIVNFQFETGLYKKVKLCFLLMDCLDSSFENKIAQNYIILNAHVGLSFFVCMFLYFQFSKFY